MNSENLTTCLVFPMGMELAPFLHRVEVHRRWKEGKATFRAARFEGAPLILIRSGVGPARAAHAVRSLRTRPAAILCVGLAGALHPELRVGDLIVASETVSETAPHDPAACRRDLVERLENACRSESGSCRRGRIVTVNRPAFSREHRERLHRDTGAVAVDMETHAAALEALKLGIPFAALRVVSDDFGAVSLTGPPGFRKLRKDPRKLLRVLATAWQWARFLRDVRRVVHLLPPVLVAFIRDS